MAIDFEWDDTKAAMNLDKHAVSFDEASTVFGDLFSITIHDPDHSKTGEDRWITLGRSVAQRLLVVVHHDIDDETIRIISSRRAVQSEIKQYTSRPM